MNEKENQREGERMRGQEGERASPGRLEADWRKFSSEGSVKESCIADQSSDS